MRTSLLILSSLALASVASASGSGSGSASSSNVASYATDPSVTMVAGSLYGESYVYNLFFLDGNQNNAPGGNPLLDPSGTAVATYSGSASGTHAGTGFTMTSTTSASLTSTADDVILNRSYGYRYFFSLTNGDTVAHDVDFSVHLQRTGNAAVTGTPYDPTTNLGEVVEADAYGGVFDLDSGEHAFQTDYTDTVDDGTPTSFSIQKDLPHTFSLAPGQTQRFEVWAASNTYLENSNPAPVPEPAPTAALGLGALALLRRRRA